MHITRALIGLAFFCLVAWLLSSHKKRFPVRVVVVGLLIQIGLGAFLLKTTWGIKIFESMSDFVITLIEKASGGSALVFGNISQGNFGEGGWGYAFAFAGTGLTVIIFFSALMSVLYHIGIMQVLIYALARMMSVTMGVSGAESMSMAANVFVGQTEAPLVVKPYVPGMTRSELNAMMTGGFATIAGSVLAVYIGILGPEYGPHLLTASVMSAPAAFLIAKIMQPETEESQTGSKVELKFERNATNMIEAAAIGTGDGLKLWLNVIAMLIAFMGLVALVDWPLVGIGVALNLEGGLSINRIFAWIFAPVAWMMGVEGWHDCGMMGSLLGTKIAVNEFIAFEYLKGMRPGEAGAVFESARSAKMAAYALCGFANFASIGIQIGGITPLAPERRGEISKLVLRAMLGGAFASWMTATVAGMFI
ncbi:MAG: nucleoside transporter C-terminal domain-containing protein [Planctomycetota bacterium]|nr:nucleoside transporter C-terminal domain-containing protein [Planctomycetota bacterium]